METASEKVLHLKQLLAERFGRRDQPSEEVYVSGFPPLDELSIPRGSLIEIVASPFSGPGGGLLLVGLLKAAAQKGERVVVIDGKNAFDPKNFPQCDLQRLLWTRCQNAKEALQAVDLAARDGNFPLIILLLALNPEAEMKRVPSTAWHRLQMLVEKSASTLFVFTSIAHVGCARLRLGASGDFPLNRFHRRRNDLMPALHLTVQRRRIERSMDEPLRRSVCA